MSLGDIFTYAAFAGTAAATLGYMATTIFTVKPKQEALVTAYGANLVRTEAQPGLHFKKPWPFNTVTAKVSTDLQQVKETLETKTKDDLFVRLPIAIQFSVEDTAKFYFENENPIETMKSAVSAAVRTATSGKDFQELYSDRDEISQSVIEHIKGTISEYGINLRRIIIDEPTAPSQVQNSFNEVRASERLKEAARNKAEAHKIEIVARAEADKQSDILRGEGKAGFRKALFEQYSEQLKTLTESGVPREEAVSVMMSTMEQDTLREIGDRGNLVIVPHSSPHSAGQLLAEVGALGRRSPAPDQDNRAGRAPPVPPVAAAPAGPPAP